MSNSAHTVRAPEASTRPRRETRLGELILVALVAVLTLPQSPVMATVRYEVTAVDSLGPLGVGATFSQISDDGVIVGTGPYGIWQQVRFPYDQVPVPRAIIWQDGVLTVAPDPGVFNKELCYGMAINASGLVVLHCHMELDECLCPEDDCCEGALRTSSCCDQARRTSGDDPMNLGCNNPDYIRSRGFTWSGSGSLNAFNASYTLYPRDINASGTVVGLDEGDCVPLEVMTVFTSASGVYANYGLLGTNEVEPASINDSDVFVGRALQQEWHAFAWDGTRHDLLDFGEESNATDINDAGIIVGRAKEGGVNRAVRWLSLSDEPQKLDGLPAAPSAINASGAVVAGGSIWESALGTLALIDLVDPEEDWSIDTAIDINASGQILAHGSQGYVILTPQGPPPYVAHPVTDQSAFNSPAPDPSHPIDGSFSFEGVDLFNGALNLSFVDAAFPGDHGQDMVVPRWYNSKLEMHDSKGKATYSVEPSSLGLGWRTDLGRLYVGRVGQPGVGDDEFVPVLELPGQRSQTFRRSKTSSQELVSQDFWVLRDEDVDEIPYRVAIDTTGTRYYFRDEEDARRHPRSSYLYLEYSTDAFDNEIRVTYQSFGADDHWPYIDKVEQVTLGREVFFIYDPVSEWDDDHPEYPRRLQKIEWAIPGGGLATVLYNVSAPTSEQHGVLNSVTDPVGLTTTFEYDPATLELTAVALPTGGRTQYSYVSHEFRASYGPEPTRVVNQRRLLFHDNFGDFLDLGWDYEYPTADEPLLPTRRVAPEGHLSEIFIHGYVAGLEWLAGRLESQVFHDGGGPAALARRAFDYEPYPFSEDGALTALMTEQSLTLLSGVPTSSRTEVSYACAGPLPNCAGSYHDYGQPNEIVDYDFDAAVPNAAMVRRTLLSYEPALPEHNIVGLPRTYKLLAPTNIISRDETYDYFSTGELRKVTRNYVGGAATTDLSYDAFGNLERSVASRSPNPAPLVTNYEYDGGRRSKVYYDDNPLQTEVVRTIDAATGNVIAQSDRNANEWSYGYDAGNRVGSITAPGSYDPTSIHYDPSSARWRDESSGPTQTYTEYDEIGRVAWTRELIGSINGSTTYAYSKSRYDSAGRVVARYEPKASIPGSSAPHTKIVYDGLGRVISTEGVGNGDGTSQFTYLGNMVTVQPPVGPPRIEVRSAFGWLRSVSSGDGTTTTYDYDPAGKLIEVDGPGSIDDRMFVYNELGHLVFERTPEAGDTHYTWGEDGSLVSKLDSDGVTTGYLYDNQGRLTQAQSSGPYSVTRDFSYDHAGVPNGGGRLTGVTITTPDGQSTIDYESYDENGRLLQRRETIAGLQFLTKYTYTGQGLPHIVTYPYLATALPLTRVEYTYNGANRVRSIKRNDSGIVQAIEYDASMRPNKLEFFGGLIVNTVTSPNQSYRPERIFTQGVLPGLDLGYSYLGDGTIEYINTNGRTDTFNYDALRRLESVQYGSALDTVEYVYDPNGNLHHRGSTNPTWASLPGFAFDHAIDDKNRIATLNYSATGRPLQDGLGATFSYGPEAELLTFATGNATLTNYVYGYNGLMHRNRRVTQSTTGATEELYVSDDAGRVLSVYERSLTGPGLGTVVPRFDFIRANGQVVASVDHKPTLTPITAAYELAYVNDHLGSARQVVILRKNGLADGRTLKKLEYFPYGYKKSESQFQLMDNPDIRVGFQGHLREGNTLLWFFGARYQHAGLGRFLTVDPVLDTELSSPHTWNRFGFVRGNPVRFVDPTGRAALVNNMTSGTMTFVPYPECPSCPMAVVPAGNDVVRSSRPGAQNGFVTEDVSVLLNAKPARAYGPSGAYLDTGDSRGRDIHGGGSRLADPAAPDQPLTPTLGCTRLCNSDARSMGGIIENFKAEHGVTVPYVRFGTPPGATHQDSTVSEGFGSAVESGRLQLVSPALAPPKSSFGRALRDGTLQLLITK